MSIHLFIYWLCIKGLMNGVAGCYRANIFEAIFQITTVPPKVLGPTIKLQQTIKIYLPRYFPTRTHAHTHTHTQIGICAAQ